MFDNESRKRAAGARLARVWLLSLPWYLFLSVVLYVARDFWWFDNWVVVVAFWACLAACMLALVVVSEPVECLVETGAPPVVSWVLRPAGVLVLWCLALTMFSPVAGVEYTGYGFDRAGSAALGAALVALIVAVVAPAAALYLLRRAAGQEEKKPGQAPGL